MRHVFVDTFYYIACLNPRDNHHQRAQTMAQDLVGSRFWTTDLVLVEVANAMSASHVRHHAANLLRALEQSPDTTIVRLTPGIYERALSLYEQRHDKEWSLTDCLSFVVMQDHNLTEALTGDHHFAQAGLSPSFRGTTP